MRNLMLLTLWAFSLSITACAGGSNAAENGETKEEGQPTPAQMEEEAWEEMMTIHDEVMPKMTAMNRVGRELKAIAETTTKKNQLEQINTAVDNLEQASEGMMAWMGDLQKLDQLRADKPHEAIMEYLNKEKQVISNVKAEMLRALEEGKKLLAELEAGHTTTDE